MYVFTKTKLLKYVFIRYLESIKQALKVLSKVASVNVKNIYILNLLESLY
jgi:hypothetical protein